MKNNILTVGVLSTSLLIVGCEGVGPKQGAGTVLGGAGGALIGSTIGKGSGKVVAVGIGAVLGSLLGSYVGGQLDERDRLLAQQNAVNTLEYSRDGSTSTWRNPNTGRYGKSTVTSTNTAGNQPCRMLTTVTYDDNGQVIGSEKQRYCRSVGGQWTRR